MTYFAINSTFLSPEYMSHLDSKYAFRVSQIPFSKAVLSAVVDVRVELKVVASEEHLAICS